MTPDASANLQELRRQLGPPRAGMAPPAGASTPTPAPVVAPSPAPRQVGTLDGLRDQERTALPGLTMKDPVWGSPAVPAGQLSLKPLQACGFACCPCCVLRGAPGLCFGWHQLTEPSSVAVWRRICRKASMLACYIDTAYLLLAVLYNGGVESLRENPMVGPSEKTLDILGAKDLARMVYDYQWWRLVTPMLLHGGLLHLLVNGITTFRMALALEEEWGTRIWLVIYCLAGVVGNLCSCAIHPDEIGLGASGSLCGILGAWLAATLCGWGTEQDYLKCCNSLANSLGGSLGMLALSFVPGLDWIAHFGGWLAGFALAFGFFCKPPAPLMTARVPSFFRWLRQRLRTIVFGSIALFGTVLLVYVVFIEPVWPTPDQERAMRASGKWPPARLPRFRSL